jgi:hypothetical protein
MSQLESLYNNKNEKKALRREKMWGSETNDTQAMTKISQVEGMKRN